MIRVGVVLALGVGYEIVRVGGEEGLGSVRSGTVSGKSGPVSFISITFAEDKRRRIYLKHKAPANSVTHLTSGLMLDKYINSQ